MLSKELINDMLRYYLYKYNSEESFNINSFQIDVNDFTYHKIDMFLLDYMSSSKIVVSKEMEETLIDKKNKILIRNIKQLNIANMIYQELVKNGIQLIFLKGIALIVSQYKNIYHRYFGDIDFLIDVKDIKKVEIVLQNMGYVFGSYSSKQQQVILASRSDILFQKTYTHELHNMVKKIDDDFYSNIDVNFKFSWNGIAGLQMKDVPFDELYERRSNIQYGDMRFPIFDTDLQFIHLCCHFYNESKFFALDREFNGGDPKELLLFRLYDIIFVGNRVNDINYIVEFCSKYECTFKMKYVLALVCLIFSEEYLSYLNKAFKIHTEDLSGYRFNEYVSNKLTISEWPIDIEERILNVAKKVKIVHNIFTTQ